MNKAKTLVLADSGCDIPVSYARDYDLRILPLTVAYHDREYADTELAPDYVYDHFREEIPKTAALNIDEVSEAVDKAVADGYERIIGITISGAMSSTFNAMSVALKAAADRIESYAFDTKNISIGSGFYAIWAALKLSEGFGFKEVVKGLEDRISNSKVFYYMDTLEYLRKGGRITPSVAIVGKLLHIKPIISCNAEGVYYTVAKIRGSSRAVQRLVEEAIKPQVQKGTHWIALLNGRGSEFASAAKQLIAERLPDAPLIIEKQIVPSMAIHTGPGLLGIGIFEL